MVFYFTIFVIVLSLTMVVLLFTKYGKKKTEFTQIVNRKFVSYFISKTKKWEVIELPCALKISSHFNQASPYVISTKRQRAEKSSRSFRAQSRNLTNIFLILKLISRRCFDYGGIQHSAFEKLLTPPPLNMT